MQQLTRPHPETPKNESKQNSAPAPFTVELSELEAAYLQTLMPHRFAMVKMVEKRKGRPKSKKKQGSVSHASVAVDPQKGKKKVQQPTAHSANSADPPSTTQHPDSHLEPATPSSLNLSEQRQQLFEVFVDNGRQCLRGHSHLIKIFTTQLRKIAQNYNQSQYPSFRQFKQAVGDVISKVKQNTGSAALRRVFESDISQELELLRPLYQRCDKNQSVSTENSRGEGETSICEGGGEQKVPKRDVVNSKIKDKAKNKKKMTKVNLNPTPKLQPAPQVKPQEQPKTTTTLPELQNSPKLQKQPQISLEDAIKINRLFKQLPRQEQLDLLQSFRRDNRLMLINRLPQSEAPEFMKAVELAIRRCGKVVSYKDSDEEEPESSFEVGASDD